MQCFIVNMLLWLSLTAASVLGIWFVGAPVWLIVVSGVVLIVAWNFVVERFTSKLTNPIVERIFCRK